MKLYDYQIIKCNYVHKPKKIVDIKLYNKLKKSPYCIEMLLDIKDYTLNELLNKKKLEYNQRISIVIQCLYIFYLMHNSGYYHRDTHSRNIMVTECEYNKIIKIIINNKSYKINTYGYIVSLIDYGMVNHKKFIKNKNDLLFDIEHNMDLFLFIDTCLINDEKNIFPYIKNIKHNPYLFLKKLYDEDYIEYLLTKNQYLGLWNDIDLIDWFNKFENDNLSKNNYFYKGIAYEMMQLLCINNRNVFCEIFNIPHFELFIDNDIVQMIKLNLNNEEKTLIYLLKYI